MGFETLRLSDVSQLTDGGSLYLGDYYSSYLFSPTLTNSTIGLGTLTLLGKTRDRHSPWPRLGPATEVFIGGEPGLLLNGGLENLRGTV